MDWDTFLRSANQINLLLFSVHFPGKNLTLGLIHMPSYSNYEKTYLRNTTLTQSSLSSNAQTACRTCTTFQCNFWEKKIRDFLGFDIPTKTKHRLNKYKNCDRLNIHFEKDKQLITSFSLMVKMVQYYSLKILQKLTSINNTEILMDFFTCMFY